MRVWARRMEAILALALILGPAVAARAAELIMATQAGCPYCQAWERDIGSVYAKTEEGRRAPLRRVDVHAPWPSDLAALADIRATPVFILWDHGHEIGRIEGYGADWAFWSALDGLIATLPTPDGNMIPPPTGRGRAV